MKESAARGCAPGSDSADFPSNSVPNPTGIGYVVPARNNLGMHCYNPGFKDLAVLSHPVTAYVLRFSRSEILLRR